MTDEDATQLDLPALERAERAGGTAGAGSSGAEAAWSVGTLPDHPGATLQDHPVPNFGGPPLPRRVPPLKPTAPGMPSAVRFDADIQRLPDGGSPPRASPSADDALAGPPTEPDGLPVASAPGDDGGVTIHDEGVPVLPRVQGSVPRPDEPRVQVSPSLELQVSQLDEPEGALDPRLAAEASASKELRRRPVEQPTEVMLPALKKREEAEKEPSDAPLYALLALLVVVIVTLAGLVTWGVLRYV